ncbi:hypothetical protein KR067_005263, partial [Drosophila pandora]
LILGIDFWRTFQLAPGIVGSIEPADSGQDFNTAKEDQYPLTAMELQQLEAVKEMFPNFEKQGLGRTSLIKHHIDTGNASSVKQRHYPISPAVEKVLYTEIDRMLELKVIAPSKSAWSSPIRMVIKPNKVRIFNYLGYIIGNGGISTDPEKISCILNWPAPRNMKQLRGFLGICNWYRRFIASFAELSFPMTELLKKSRKFTWTNEAQEAMEKLKVQLTSAPVLQNADFTKKFFLHCDASDFGIGAVLVQLSDEGE